MESWRRLAVLGALVGLFAGGCVITSGDDDDTTASAGSGGTEHGSGGSSNAGETGSDTGGTSAAGATGTAGANACEEAIGANCDLPCGDDCMTELYNAQDCLTNVINENNLPPTYEEQYGCADSAGIDGGVITTEFSDMFACMICSEAVADICLGGFDDPPDCGAGGAGG